MNTVTLYESSGEKNKETKKKKKYMYKKKLSSIFFIFLIKVQRVELVLVFFFSIMHAVPQQLRQSMEVAAQRKYKMYLHVYQSL